jgi:hypothetical protein
MDAVEGQTPYLKFLQKGSPIPIGETGFSYDDFLHTTNFMIDSATFVKEIDPTAKLLALSSKYGFLIAGVFSGANLVYFKAV